MLKPPDLPDSSIEISLEEKEVFRKHLHERGFTNAAIEEFFKGHSISSAGLQEVFPGLTLPGEEKVYKDGKPQDIGYPDEKQRLPRP